MQMTLDSRRVGRRLLRGIAYAAVGTKFLIPVGYMPGPLAAGSPVQLCDAGFYVPAHAHDHAAHAGHGAHQEQRGQHDHGKKTDELKWKHCPSGALAAAGAIPVEYRLDLPPGEAERLPLRDAGRVTRARFTAFRSRAPPLRA
jgi:hypothetical protein